MTALDLIEARCSVTGWNGIMFRRFEAEQELALVALALSSHADPEGVAPRVAWPVLARESIVVDDDYDFSREQETVALIGVCLARLETEGFVRSVGTGWRLTLPDHVEAIS